MAPKPTTSLLKQLRCFMQDLKYVSEPLSAYIVTSNDAHNSEYLAECDQFRAFISGFTGSAGTVVVTENSALLWTDGRYYLQAGQQLDENWSLMKQGLPDTPSEGDWLKRHLSKGSAVGVDPKLITYKTFNNLQTELELTGHKLIPVKENLVQQIWNERPSRPSNPVIPLEREFTGISVKDKLEEVNEEMKTKNAKYLVISALDEVAWFLNLRGSDIDYNPVFFSYIIIAENCFTVFINPSQNSKAIIDHLSEECGDVFKIEPYDKIWDNLKEITKNLNDNYVWFAETSSYALTNIVPKKNRIITHITPVELMKAVKNPVEVNGMKNAHIKDAAALCCYFAWLEKNVKTIDITEVSGAEKLLEFRKLQRDFVGASFPTISSVGPHGAIIHYQPSKETDVKITTDTLYLCDSGGQYKDGTTDVTRTFHFGQPSQYEKLCYTRVLKGQIKLATAVFPSKIKGNCLDAFARQFLWEVGLDYGHGTGHGIGSYLNVHEGPMGISRKPYPQDPGLEPNMFLSNEPGYYQDGQFGIRIEDIVRIIKAKTEHNFENRDFLTFETVTLVPKSKKLIVVEILTDEEIKYLNEYHKKCRDVIGPVLEEQKQHEAKEWLMRETEPISR